jgi:hypothetical protein
MYTQSLQTLWANTIHRIERKVFHLPKFEGGFNHPDLELYQLATQGFYLRHIVEYTKDEQWVNTEDANAHPQNLFTCLFSKDKDKNINNFTDKNNITIWKNM